MVYTKLYLKDYQCNAVQIAYFARLKPLQVDLQQYLKRLYVSF